MPELFKDFKQRVLDLAHPEGLAIPLQQAFESDVICGLVYAQRWIPSLKSRNRSVYPFCGSYFACGATVIGKPRGNILRVSTATDGCCEVFYDYVSDYDAFINWLNANRRKWTEPPNAGMPPLPKPFKFSEAITDRGRRSNSGRWTIRDDQIFIGQRIESTEEVWVRWHGIRREYLDDTPMPYGAEDQGDVHDLGVELADLVASYARMEDMRKFRRDVEGYAVEKSAFEMKLAEMKYTEYVERSPAVVGSHGDLEFDQLTVSGPCKTSHCIPPVVNEDTVFAIIGDYGAEGDTTNRDAVAALVKSWNPLYVATTGDNWYGSDVTLSSWELLAAAPYRNFIYPWRSYQTPKLLSAATQNNFYACIGNHDRDPDGRLAVELAGFNFPQVYRSGAWGPSTGYYSVVRSHVEHFFYDSGYDNSQVNRQADGNDLNSIQAVWLQTALANSQARWRVVHIHHPGYTSTATAATDPTFVGDGYLDYSAIRNITNKLKEWGADLVTHGHAHNYERLNVAGLPILINGLGGRDLYPFGSPRIWSQFRYYAQFGAIKVTVNCDSLKAEFISVDGQVQDTLLLEK